MTVILTAARSPALIESDFPRQAADDAELVRAAVAMLAA